MDFKDIKFPVKISDTHKIKKRKKNCIGISVLGYKNKSKNTFKKDVDILLFLSLLLLLSLLEKKDKKHYVLVKNFNKRHKALSLKILTQSCTIILYIVKESIFVVNVYKLLGQNKYGNVILMIALKSMVNKRLKDVNMFNML